MIKLAGAQGYYGDSHAPLADLLSEEPDFIVAEALAELTLAILQKDRQRDSSLGYTRDLPLYLKDIMPAIVGGKTRFITNAGGINPAGAAAAIENLAGRFGISGVKIAIVTGDGFRHNYEELREATGGLCHIDTGVPCHIDEPSFATAYLGATAVAAALDAGAQIVITGRVADASLFLGPMIHTFQWAPDDWDRLAAGVVVGHLCECSGQVAGGNFSGDWRSVLNPARYGFPIAEVDESGTAIITKPEVSGGLVSFDTVKEQLLYEVGDPRQYISPDCVADFTAVELKDDGPNRVRVSGAKGSPATDQYKAIVCGHAGWSGEGRLAFAWPDALGKARRAAGVLLERLEVLGGADETCVEYFGASRGGRPGGVFGPATDDELDDAEKLPLAEQPNEVIARIAMRTDDEKLAGKFAREFAALGLSGPPAVFGLGRGGGGPSELLDIWPTLVPKSAIDPHVSVEVSTLGGNESESSNPLAESGPGAVFTRLDPPPVTEAAPPAGALRKVQLGEFAMARSGDKADLVNVALFAPDDSYYELIKSAVTAEVVKVHLGRLVLGKVTRYEIPNLRALNFVCEQALDGGAPKSIRADNLGKAMGAHLLALEIEIPATTSSSS